MGNNILLVIRKYLNSLPQSEKKIAGTILNDPASVIHMSATQLAFKAESSSAAVIRFCHSIGLKGFTELKLKLSADSHGIRENLYTEISPKENLDQIKKKMVLNVSHVFNETNQILDSELIATATKIFNEAYSIYVYGLGASHIVALDFQQKLSRIGKEVICSQDQHMLVTSMSVSEKSVLLAISNSGEKMESIALTKTAKALGLKTVSLTRDTKNRLSLTADVALKTANTQEAPLRSGATISLLTQLYAIDLLFYDYAVKHYDITVEKLEKSKEAIQLLKDHYET